MCAMRCCKVIVRTQVVASTFDEFFPLVTPFKANLPVITSELGDTWIHGCPSDPKKVQIMREIHRVRAACVASGECTNDDPTFFNHSRLLLKNGEHTWGEDVKTWLHDVVNWNNSLFEEARNASNFIQVRVALFVGSCMTTQAAWAGRAW